VFTRTSTVKVGLSACACPRTCVSPNLDKRVTVLTNL
jgi:hypothetical protein